LYQKRVKTRQWWWWLVSIKFVPSSIFDLSFFHFLLLSTCVEPLWNNRHFFCIILHAFFQSWQPTFLRSIPSYIHILLRIQNPDIFWLTKIFFTYSAIIHLFVLIFKCFFVIWSNFAALHSYHFYQSLYQSYHIPIYVFVLYTFYA
jgi:hypothetical protein